MQTLLTCIKDFVFLIVFCIVARLSPQHNVNFFAALHSFCTVLYTIMFTQFSCDEKQIGNVITKKGTHVMCSQFIAYY